jgi:DNA adenine methylase
MKPFLKWTGNKFKMISSIREYYPKGLGKEITGYIEPFVGSGAVLFDIIDEVKSAVVADVNSSLTTTFDVLTNDRSRLRSRLASMEEMYYLMSEKKKRTDWYVQQRKRFNELRKIQKSKVELAALFILLNKLCFNGMYRVNLQDEFNSPFYHYTRAKICDTESLEKCGESLNKVCVKNVSFDKLELPADCSKTLFYIDPPYYTENSDVVLYTSERPNKTFHTRLRRFVEKAEKRGGKVMISHSICELYENLYADGKHYFHKIVTPRKQACKNHKRESVHEWLITNYAQ